MKAVARHLHRYHPQAFPLVDEAASGWLCSVRLYWDGHDADSCLLLNDMSQVDDIDHQFSLIQSRGFRDHIGINFRPGPLPAHGLP